MSAHQSTAARAIELVDELIALLRAEGLMWRHVRGFVTSAVDEAQEREEHPEDYDCGSEDEETGVYQLAPPYCRLDDDRGAA